MIALIMKDIATLKRTILLTVTMCIGISCYGIYESELLIVPLVFAVLPIILTAIAFGYDTKSNFEQFAFSLPIKKSSYVFSKLFFAFAFGVVGSICIFSLLIIKSQMSIDNIFLISIITFVASLLISAIQLPFILKYGAEKGRLVMIITYFVIFAFMTLFKEMSGSVMEVLGNYTMSTICLAIIIMSVITIVIAVKFSLIVMERKEY